MPVAACPHQTSAVWGFMPAGQLLGYNMFCSTEDLELTTGKQKLLLRKKPFSMQDQWSWTTNATTEQTCSQGSQQGEEGVVCAMALLSLAWCGEEPWTWGMNGGHDRRSQCLSSSS